MALTLADRPLHKLTVDDVLRMLASGVITEDAPVELLEGVLVDVSPKSPEHGWVIVKVDEWLSPLRGTGLSVRAEQPIVVGDRASMPEPDLSVVGGLRRDVLPTTALLVVEVSVSSLRIDREVKAPLYATAEVPEYWIVDVEARRLEVHRDPVDGAYRDVRALGPADEVAPLALDLPPLALASIF